MKKNPGLYLFGSALIVLLVLRLILKLFCIDPQTGFYAHASWLGVIFEILVLAAAVLFLLLGFVKPKVSLLPSGRPPLDSRIIPYSFPGSAIFLRLVVAAVLLHAVSVFFGWNPNIGLGEMKTFSILLACLDLLAVLAIEFTVFCMSQNEPLPYAFVSVVIILWSLVFLIHQYMRFTTVNCVSDEKLELLALCASMLFWYVFARIVSRSMKPGLLRFLSAFGYLTALLCLVLTVPQIFAVIFTKVTMKDFFFSSHPVLLATGLFSFVFTNRILNPILYRDASQAETFDF